MRVYLGNAGFSARIRQCNVAGQAPDIDSLRPDEAVENIPDQQIYVKVWNDVAQRYELAVYMRVGTK